MTLTRIDEVLESNTRAIQSKLVCTVKGSREIIGETVQLNANGCEIYS